MENASFKFKPLSAAPVRVEIIDATGAPLEDRVRKLGEYLDLTIPPGGKIILSNVESEDGNVQ